MAKNACTDRLQKEYRKLLKARVRAGARAQACVWVRSAEVAAKVCRTRPPT